MKKEIILTASANVGRGLWTSICVFFCDIFGRESLAFKAKQRRILESAKYSIDNQLNNLGEDFHLQDIRIFHNKPLSVSMTALAVCDDYKEENIQAKRKSNKPMLETEEEPSGEGYFLLSQGDRVVITKDVRVNGYSLRPGMTGSVTDIVMMAGKRKIMVVIAGQVFKLDEDQVALIRE